MKLIFRADLTPRDRQEPTEDRLIDPPPIDSPDTVHFGLSTQIGAYLKKVFFSGRVYGVVGFEMVDCENWGSQIQKGAI
jgi:hypothetical protein